jgi:N utilization substance protein B
MLYQWDATGEPMEVVAGAYWRVRSTTDATRAAAERLAFGAVAHLPAIDAAIASALSNWRMDRLAAVDKGILRLATFELMHDPETPPAVVLDEAIELAKRFSEAQSPAFVNGVLDAVRQKVRGEAAAPPPGGAKR